MGKFFLIIIAISVAVLLATSAYVISLDGAAVAHQPDPKAPAAASGRLRRVLHFGIWRAQSCRFKPSVSNLTLMSSV